MSDAYAKSVVHLELHTGDLPRACETYARLCGWHPQRVHTDAGPYLSLEMGGRLRGGVVECGTPRPLWLPYVEVSDVDEATQRALDLGGSVMLEPRGGPAGRRSVVSTPAGGEVAFWQPFR